MEQKTIFEIILSGLVFIILWIMIKFAKAKRFQEHWNEAVFKKQVHRSTRNDYIIANHISNQEVFLFTINPVRNRLFFMYKKKPDRIDLLEQTNKSLTK